MKTFIPLAMLLAASLLQGCTAAGHYDRVEDRYDRHEDRVDRRHYSGPGDYYENRVDRYENRYDKRRRYSY